VSPGEWGQLLDIGIYQNFDPETRLCGIGSVRVDVCDGLWHE